MKSTTKFPNQQKWQEKNNSLQCYVQKRADHKNEKQRGHRKNNRVNCVLINFLFIWRNGSCREKPFHNNFRNLMYHLILLKRSSPLGAFGWWIIKHELVLALTNKIAVKHIVAKDAIFRMKSFFFMKTPLKIILTLIEFISIISYLLGTFYIFA